MEQQDRYTQLAYQTSQRVTRAYSTSFSTAITLLDKPLQKHVHALYGLVRLADEIVDSFRPDDMLQQLNDLELEVHRAIQNGFSTNMLVHSFAITAKQYQFSEAEIEAFFGSMQTDISTQTFSQSVYEQYIYGSAEVVGLMSLRIFCEGSKDEFEQLSKAAKSLGAAFQKINFLRDIAADNKQGRMYFPGVRFGAFTEADKRHIIADIKTDLQVGRKGLMNLPRSSRYGVVLALYYYEALLQKLQCTPASQIVSQRLRVADTKKVWLYLLVRLQKIGQM
jgi:phytoene synthase